MHLKNGNWDKTHNLISTIVLKKSAYRSLLVHIGTVLQQMHHTVIMALPGSPDQGCGAILTTTSKNSSVMTKICINSINNECDAYSCI